MSDGLVVTLNTTVDQNANYSPQVIFEILRVEVLHPPVAPEKEVHCMI
jgi:hypothetical protein